MLFGLIKRVPVFDTFIEGALEGLQSALKIMPALTALTLCVSMIKASGCLDAAGQALAPIIGAVNIPTETVPLMLIRPVSGSGALTVIQNIFKTTGPDSYAGRVASVMMGSTDSGIFRKRGNKKDRLHRACRTYSRSHRNDIRCTYRDILHVIPQ